MPSASIKKKIPCSKKNLIEMVLDIEKYPEFVPWCLDGKIHDKIDKEIQLKLKLILLLEKVFSEIHIKVLLFIISQKIRYM